MDLLDVFVANVLVPEIISKITNPLQLVKLRFVSEFWKEMISKSWDTADWRSCLKKIGSPSFDAILTSTLPDELFNSYDDISQENWKLVFFSYINWKKFYHPSVEIELRKFIEFDSENSIRSMDVRGKHLVIGKSLSGPRYFGGMQMFNSYNLRLTDDMTLTESISEPNVMKLWRSVTGKLMLAIQEPDSHAILFDIANSFLNSEVRALTVQLSSAPNGGIYAYSVPLRKILKFTDVLPTGVITHIQSVELLSDHIISDNDLIFDIYCSRSQVYTWFYGRTLMKLVVMNDVVNSELGNHVLKIDRIHFWRPVPMLNLPTQAYCVTANIGIFVDTQNIVILTNLDNSEQSIVHTIETLFDPPINQSIYSILLHGNTLICGLPNGKLHIFYIDDLNQITSQDLFNNIPRKVINVNTSKPIEFLGVCENDCKPIIFAVYVGKNDCTCLTVPTRRRS